MALGIDRRLHHNTGTCEKVLVGVLPEVNRGCRPVEVLVPVGGDDEPVAASKPVPFAAGAALDRFPRRREVHRGEGRDIVGAVELVVEESYAPGGEGHSRGKQKTTNVRKG